MQRLASFEVALVRTMTGTAVHASRYKPARASIPRWYDTPWPVYLSLVTRFGSSVAIGAGSLVLNTSHRVGAIVYAGTDRPERRELCATATVMFRRVGWL